VNDTPSIYPLRPESQAAPTPLFGNDVDSFVQQLRLAAQAHRAGRLDEAIASYLRLLAVRPYHAELHNNLGVALRLAGKLEASVSHHRLSLAADPDNPALHSNLGNALRAANRLDEAVKHHYQSITLNRDYAEASSIWRSACAISAGSTKPSAASAGPWHSIPTTGAPGSSLPSRC